MVFLGMIVKRKKGVSPVIATVLLVAIVLVLAVIVFLWARNFVGESVEKQGRDVDQSCAETSFRAEIIFTGDEPDDEKTLFIENTGTVPLYGAELRKKQVIGEIKLVDTFDGSVSPGATGEINLTKKSGDLAVEDSVLVVPILLGETQTQKKAYICDSEYGVETTIYAFF